MLNNASNEQSTFDGYWEKLRELQLKYLSQLKIFHEDQLKNNPTPHNAEQNQQIKSIIKLIEGNNGIHNFSYRVEILRGAEVQIKKWICT